MFNDEAEFRREFDEYPAAAGYLLPYSPDTEFFDRFLAANYHRIPEDAWVTNYLGQRSLSRMQTPGVWRILNSVYLLGIERSYYATGVPAAGMFAWQHSDDYDTDDTPTPPPTQAEIDDARHQRQMDYIATLPVEPVDPTPRYNSQTPEYVTAYDLGVTPSPLGEPPEYLPPVPVYTTPEYCETDVCPENAVWGQPHCQECARLNLDGRSGWRAFFEDWKSGKFIHPDADAPEWIKHKTYAEFLEDFAWENDGTPRSWIERWAFSHDSSSWAALGFDENVLERVAWLGGLRRIGDEYEDFITQGARGRKHRSRKPRRSMNSCRSRTRRSARIHKKKKKSRRKRKYVHRKRKSRRK